MKKIITLIAIIFVATISSSKVRGGKGGSVIQSSFGYGVGAPFYGGSHWGSWGGYPSWGVGAPLYNNWGSGFGGYGGLYNNGWGSGFGYGVGAGVFDQNSIKGGVGIGGVFDQNSIKGGVGFGGVFDQGQNQGIPITPVPVPVTPSVPDKGTVIPTPTKDTTIAA